MRYRVVDNGPTFLRQWDVEDTGERYNDGLPLVMCECFTVERANKIAETLNVDDRLSLCPTPTLGPNLDAILTLCWQHDLQFTLSSDFTSGAPSEQGYSWSTKDKEGQNNSGGPHYHFADAVTDLLSWLSFFDTNMETQNEI